MQAEHPSLMGEWEERGSWLLPDAASPKTGNRKPKTVFGPGGGQRPGTNVPAQPRPPSAGASGPAGRISKIGENGNGGKGWGG